MTTFTTLPELHLWVLDLLEGTPFAAREELPAANADARPYFLVAEVTELASGNRFGASGAAPEFAVRAYSADESGREIAAMVRAARAVIDGQTFSGPGYATARARWVDTQTVADPEGGTQVVIRYRIQANAT